MTSSDKAEYLDTQTLGGDKDYFHTGTGVRENPSEPTPLVTASQGQAEATDELDEMTKPELRELILERGIDFDGNLSRASKPELIEALRD